jgi:hypothetical protein
MYILGERKAGFQQVRCHAAAHHPESKQRYLRSPCLFSPGAFSQASERTPMKRFASFRSMLTGFRSARPNPS